jgi:hypothetical protein
LYRSERWILYATPNPTVRLVIVPVTTLNEIPMRNIVPRIHATENNTGNNVTPPRLADPSVTR